MEKYPIAQAGGFAGGSRRSSGGGEKNKVKMIYMFLGHSPDCGCAHTLYALEIPDKKFVQYEPGRPLPILTFLEDEYPTGMLCVKLNLKLYFIGGTEFVDGRTCCRRDVLILDLEKRVPEPGTQPGETYKYLEGGPSMMTGKSKMEAICFAAVGKIFVLSVIPVCPYTSTKLIPCEMFTPGSSDGSTKGKWEKLPNPPYKSFPVGHVVVEKKAFISCEDETVYTFNLESFVWSQVVEPPFIPGQVSLFVDSKLYIWYCDPYNVFFQTLRVSPDTKEVAACEDWKALDLGMDRVGTWYPSGCLAHDDETGRLCFLEVGSSPHPKYEDNPVWCHPEQCVVKLHVYDSKSGWFLNASVFIVSSQEAITTALSSFVV